MATPAPGALIAPGNRWSGPALFIAIPYSASSIPDAPRQWKANHCPAPRGLPPAFGSDGRPWPSPLAVNRSSVARDSSGMTGDRRAIQGVARWAGHLGVARMETASC